MLSRLSISRARQYKCPCRFNVPAVYKYQFICNEKIMENVRKHHCIWFQLYKYEQNPWSAHKTVHILWPDHHIMHIAHVLRASATHFSRHIVEKSEHRKVYTYRTKKSVESLRCTSLNLTLQECRYPPLKA